MQVSIYEVNSSHGYTILHGHDTVIMLKAFNNASLPLQGGADQSMPVIVSRVATNTPADNCIPKLNEGDQVLYINGRDISTHTHEQVLIHLIAS